MPTSTPRELNDLAPEHQRHLDNVRTLILRDLDGPPVLPDHVRASLRFRAALYLAELEDSARRGEIDFDAWLAGWRGNDDIPDDLEL
jgi:hypothetical protein